MMPVLEAAVSIAPSAVERIERERLAALRWEHWGREIGLLTPEQIARNNNPLWMWDDYAI